MENFELLEQCYLSGQMSDAQLHELMRDDPAFAEWITKRAQERELADA